MMSERLRCLVGWCFFLFGLAWAGILRAEVVHDPLVAWSQGRWQTWQQVQQPSPLFRPPYQVQQQVQAKDIYPDDPIFQRRRQRVVGITTFLVGFTFLWTGWFNLLLTLRLGLLLFFPLWGWLFFLLGLVGLMLLLKGIQTMDASYMHYTASPYWRWRRVRARLWLDYLLSAVCFALAIVFFILGSLAIGTILLSVAVIYAIWISVEAVQAKRTWRKQRQMLNEVPE